MHVMSQQSVCPPVLLSIAIPTFNRVTYLSDLLPSLIDQVFDMNSEGRNVEIVINDNASTDGTDHYVQSFLEQCAYLRYYRNESNFGSEINFARSVERSEGKYVWLVGDDDILEPDALRKILSTIEKYKPALLICIDALKIITGMDPTKYYAATGDGCTIFENYREFLAYYSEHEMNLIPAHTWIPSIIFLKSVFDKNMSQKMIPIDYSYMFAIAQGLKPGGNVCVLRVPVLQRREIRAAHAFENIPRKMELFLVWLGTAYENRQIKWPAVKRNIVRRVSPVWQIPAGMLKKVLKFIIRAAANAKA